MESCESMIGWIEGTYKRLQRNPPYRILAVVLGIFTLLPVAIVAKCSARSKGIASRKRELTLKFMADGTFEKLLLESRSQLKRKDEFFQRDTPQKDIERLARNRANQKLEELIDHTLHEEGLPAGDKVEFLEAFRLLLHNKAFFSFSLIASAPMYLLMALYASPYVKFIFERVLMLMVVLVGVAVVVFSIVYVSPTDPARNVLGLEASREAVESFNSSYGLDQPYLKQLQGVLRKLISFDLGRAYSNRESVSEAISRKLPVTMLFGLGGVLVSFSIALPAGIISAVRQYSAADYTLMFLALLGLSIPNFWLGLILILNLSVRLRLLPASYQAGNMMSLLMPAFVIGTSMSASLARMTRASMLEVIKSDYVVTARAKGLSEFRVTMRHILKNAMIPIVTVMGFQIIGVFDGASTIEKVFTISGVGGYMADATLLPDTPVVLSSAVYMSSIVSVGLLVIDILYTFLDPRIKTRIKNY